MATAVAGLVFVGGCGSGDAASDGAPVAMAYSDASESLPFETLGDWRSYADAVAVVRVGSERSEEDAVASKEGQRDPLRFVDLKIEHVLWSRSGVAVGGELELQTSSWVERRGQRVPVAPSDGPRLEVGRRYAIGLMVPPHEPGAMTASSVLPLDGDVITGLDRSSPLAASLAGTTVAELEEEVLAAQPDPLAVEHADLPPVERYTAVLRDRASD